jgi:hypothetical protein
VFAGTFANFAQGLYKTNESLLLGELGSLALCRPSFVFNDLCGDSTEFALGRVEPLLEVRN